MMESVTSLSELPEDDGESKDGLPQYHETDSPLKHQRINESNDKNTDVIDSPFGVQSSQNPQFSTKIVINDNKARSFVESKDFSKF